MWTSHYQEHVKNYWNIELWANTASEWNFMKIIICLGTLSYIFLARRRSRDVFSCEVKAFLQYSSHCEPGLNSRHVLHHDSYLSDLDLGFLGKNLPCCWIDLSHKKNRPEPFHEIPHRIHVWDIGAGIFPYSWLKFVANVGKYTVVYNIPYMDPLGMKYWLFNLKKLTMAYYYNPYILGQYN